MPDAVTSTSALMDDSRVRLLDRDESDMELDDSEDSPHQYPYEHPWPRRLSGASSADPSVHPPRGYIDDSLPNIFGAELWKSGDFWLLFTMLSIRTCFLFSLHVSSCAHALRFALPFIQHKNISCWNRVDV